ncbi:peptidase S10 [uncultured Brevundimonas sp.]|uniref:S10 family peptidase n=1 Tax=uncultured Brevundimonas sp. TaxID=213418 RepID=UPI002600F7EE|nr:peptidase S10 [uncultured Brevundimonas sp.]
MKRLICLAAIAAMLGAPVAALAQESGTNSSSNNGGGGAMRSATDRFRNANAEAIEKDWARAPVEETEVTTAHSVNAHGKTLRYKATAGTLTIRDDAGMPTASLFYTAYTLDGQPVGTRPVTYLYNGGPGSPTVWLHMGSFGPMRVQTDEPTVVRPAPFAFGPNDQTLLDQTDLVFIDMVGAGFSRPLGETPGSTFWGVDGDADAFARAIMRYTTKFSRWSSPKYIIGESYGTLRTGAVAFQLEDRGMSLNGVVLLSSIMNYGVRQPGYPQNFVTLLPTYAATAWYHRKLANPAATVEEQVQRARDFALGPYASALAKGHMISDAERADIVRQMSELTGLSTTFIDNANMRVDLGAFRKELLRDRRQTIGRLDTRYMGLDEDAAGGEPEDDPSSSAVTGAYFGIFRDYVANELNYKTDVEYRMSARGLPGFNWNWSHRPPVGGPQTTPNTAIDLATAMRRNPYLKVMSLNGYYDAATPFFSTEFDLAQMMLEPSLRPNLEFTYYEGGHMMYLSHDALVKLHVDLSRFYSETANGGAR